jgi:uncharacterized repeat protein (TIGR02543 family)
MICFERSICLFLRRLNLQLIVLVSFAICYVSWCHCSSDNLIFAEHKFLDDVSMIKMSSAEFSCRCGLVHRSSVLPIPFTMDRGNFYPYLCEKGNTDDGSFHTITFNGNGAICGVMSGQTIEEGASASLILNGFFRNGYTFSGWNTEPNGSGLSYGNGAIYIMESGNITLYAQWSEGSSPANVGDYRSRISGNWGANTTWEKFDGNCWFACSSGDYPNSSTVSVRITNGHTIDNDGSGSPPWNVKDLIVETGGRLWDNQFGGINTYVQIYGDILCNGIIGDPLGDDISFDIAGGNDCSISGTGSFTAMRIRKDDAINPSFPTTLTVQMDIGLLRPETSGTVLYNDANQPGTDLVGSLFHVVINSGVTVRCSGRGSAMSNLSIDGFNGADPENCGGSFVISGLLDIDGIIYCKNNNSSKYTSLVIKNGGVVKCRYIETGASGLAGNTLRIENGGKLSFFGSVDTTITSLNNTTLNGFSIVNNTWELESGSTLEYSGRTEQKIHGISECSNLTVSGGGLKRLDTDFTVGGMLKLENGIIQTGLKKLIHRSTFPLDLIHTSGGSSFIFGTYRRYMVSNSSIYEFPVGLSLLSSGYRRMDLVNNYLNGLEFLDVSVAPVSETGYNIDARLTCSHEGIKLYNIIENTVWKLLPNANPSSGTYGVRLFLEGTGLSSSDNNNFYAVKRADGSVDYNDWETFDSTTTIPSSGTDGRTFGSGDGYAERLGYTSFSEHAIGLGLGIEPLPVDLMDFSVNCTEKDNIKIYWSTATEYNSSHFQIEKSNNGLIWNELSVLEAAGNSNSAISYFFEDRLASELTYYRLCQVDLNGNKVTYEPVSVWCKQKDFSLLTVPNPSCDTFNLLYHSNERSVITVRITDAHEKEVYCISKQVDEGGNNVMIIPKLYVLPGIYFIHVHSLGGEHKVIRHHIF